MEQHPIFEIESVVRGYLDRKVTLQQLRAWFALAKGALLALPAEMPGTRLAGLAELAFIEMKDGALTERQFRSLLREELRRTGTHVFVEGNPNLTLSSSTTNAQVVALDDILPSRQSSTSVLQETVADI